MKISNRANFLFFGIVLLICCLWGNLNNAPIYSADPSYTTRVSQIAQTSNGDFVQAPLPYDYNALEPFIDAKTMEIHYTGHHGGYLKKFKKTLEKHPELKGKTLEQILGNIDNIPSDIRTSIRNNGGGHYNHTVFWAIMTPNGGGEPNGEFATAINNSFGSFEEFKAQFKAESFKRFGSGWVWLVRDKNGRLEITSSPGQDNPIMEGKYPILGTDVWEHAYYLNYKNSRGSYVDAWWNTINWDEVNARFKESQTV